MKQIEWPYVFINPDDAIEYRNKFFPACENLVLMALYFDPVQAEQFLADFPEEPSGAIVATLRRGIPETDESQTLIGYDLVGAESSSGDFHTFQCHNLSAELEERFGLRMNSFGLFDEVTDWAPVLDYLNHESNGCEPVPWYAVKVKLVE